MPAHRPTALPNAQTPDGTTIEILPKVGKAFSSQENTDTYLKDNQDESRKILLKMLVCLQSFRHIVIEPASLLAAKMPLLEVFITDFLNSVEHIAKRGLRSQYNSNQDNLFALKGKLLIDAFLKYLAAFDELSSH